MPQNKTRMFNVAYFEGCRYEDGLTHSLLKVQNISTILKRKYMSTNQQIRKIGYVSKMRESQVHYIVYNIFHELFIRFSTVCLHFQPMYVCITYFDNSIDDAL